MLHTSISSSRPLAIRSIATMGLALLLLTPSVRADFLTPRQVTTVPLHQTHTFAIPYVDVDLNNRAPGLFVVDSGAEVNAVSESLVKRLGLRVTPLNAPDGHPIIFDDKPAVGVRIPMASIGGIDIHGLPCVVMGNDRLTPVVGQPVDGAIGFGTIKRMAVIFDPDHNKATFIYPGGLYAQELFDLGFVRPYRCPLVYSPRTGVCYVPVKVNYRDGSASDMLMLDTGSNYSAISRRMVDALQLPVSQSGDSGITLGHVTELDHTILDSMQVGPFKVRYQPVSYPTRRVPPTFFHVGMDVFRGHRILIDYAARTLYVSR